MITFHGSAVDNLAYVAENQVILAGIVKQLEAAGDRVAVKYGATVKDYRLPGGQATEHAQVVLTSGEEIRAKLLVITAVCLVIEQELYLTPTRNTFEYYTSLVLPSSNFF